MRIVATKMLSTALLLGAPGGDTEASCIMRCRCKVDASLSFLEQVRQHHSRAAVVYSGTVIRIEDVTRHGKEQAIHPAVAVLAVDNAWKGAIRDTAYLAVSRGNSCDLPVALGESYIIFAAESSIGLHGTRQCMGTTTRERGGATAAALDDIAADAP